MVLSICISSYNRSSDCNRLVKRLLQIPDERFNVWVCDDCSEDGTIEQLEKIEDKRLHIHRNSENLGACRNWFETIDYGDGKYLLHVLDRDILDTTYMASLLDILEIQEIAGGYICGDILSRYKRKAGKNGIQRYGCGEDALLMFGGVPIHPTGFLIARKYWKQKNYRPYFENINRYGIYPHSYIYSDIACKGDMIFFSIPFYRTNMMSGSNVSRFYMKQKKDYWWLPEQVFRFVLCTIRYMPPMVSGNLKEKFIFQRYIDGLYRTTFFYKRTVENIADMSRYGLKSKRISEVHLIIIGIWYIGQFCRAIKKIDTAIYVKNKSQFIKRGFQTLYQILQEVCL